MLVFLKNNALAVAMVIGVLGFPWFRHLGACLPWLIFFMLFFTFCKVNPIDLRLHRWHWLLLTVQLLLSVAVYYLLLPLNHVLAQGIMLCFIMPSATAAPIIAGKLGGSIQSLTSFTMLSNIATAVVVPLFFPLVNPAADMSFWWASLMILRKVTPLLLGPFFAAWLLRLGYDAVQRRKGSGKRFHLSRSWAQLPFYLWAMSLVVLMAQITYSLLYDQYDLWVALAQAGGALIACILQFFIGKKIGEKYPSAPHGEDYQDDSEILKDDNIDNQQKYKYQTRISAGQALGQKNTTLGIWMANTYLNPIAALGAAAYIIWQNVFNSWQLYRASQGRKC
ncbi:MAG: transporter [Paludibacteraceae bacterium]|nr:transporter [Paludibacteraceae bacterium]